MSDAERYDPNLLMAMQHMLAAMKHLNFVCEDAPDGTDISHLVNTIMVMKELCDAVYPCEPAWDPAKIISVDFHAKRRA